MDIRAGGWKATDKGWVLESPQPEPAPEPELIPELEPEPEREKPKTTTRKAAEKK